MIAKNKLHIMCCVCKKVKADSGRFFRRNLPAGALISHTYCPKCAKEALAMLEEFRTHMAATHA